MSHLINIKYSKSENNEIFETWTFSGNEQKICFSYKLHKLNFIASLYDKNIELYKDFIFC